MYGLPQAGRIAMLQLMRRLKPYGYTPCKFMPGLWKHETLPIQFVLVVDDFGIKYTDIKHFDHLTNPLKECNYPYSTDMKGECYVGIHLDWDYENRKVTLSMPGYVSRALAQYAHKNTKAKAKILHMLGEDHNTVHAFNTPSHPTHLNHLIKKE